VASHLFKGIRFASTSALVLSALLLVANLANGFKVDGFWTGLWASLFIAVLSLVLGAFVLGGTPDFQIQTSPGPGSVWL
jgi:putative membrane protein